MYGYEVRVPLTLLRGAREGEHERESAVNIVSYVIQMREQLQKMSDLAQQLMAEA